MPQQTQVKSPKTQKNFRIQNVEDIIRLEEREKEAMVWSEKISEAITCFAGSMFYVGLHILWFGGWILINLNIIPGIPQFDPFPFSLLTMMVSLEAIFLSVFVLISQNRQAMVSEKRAKIDLQVDMITEREITKLIEMSADIHQHLNIRNKRDSQLEELQKTADINRLADKIDKEEAKNKKKKSK